MRFTGGCAYKGQWFQTAGTELIIYDLPHWTIHRIISFPSFNDLHGVTVIDDEIGIVNTGLEIFQVLNINGDIKKEFNAMDEPGRIRFDRTIDYRHIGSIKPHQVQINNAFQIDGDWWVTRCLSQDAINLNNREDRIPIGVGQPHDGLICGDFIFFTTTNAHIVIACTATRKIEEVINLNALRGKREKMGWCRGIVVKGLTAYVGFTRLRRSKWHGLFDITKDFMRGRKSHSFIQKVDLERKTLLDCYNYSREGSPDIFALADFEYVTGASNIHEN